MRSNGTAYITGGSSGIGLAVARALLQRGWKVSICARSSRKLADAEKELVSVATAASAARAADSSGSLARPSEGPGRHSGTGGRAPSRSRHDDRHDDPKERLLAQKADVASEADVKRWIGASLERLGPPSLLVNNAGIGVWEKIESLSEKEWDRVLDVNLKGAFLCTREILPAMRKNGGGYVVNIASISGKKGMAGSSAYCASKFGMVGFTESLIAEEKNNHIRATSICPGFVATPMVEGVSIPASEMIQTDDIVATILYLLELSPQVVIREIVIERVGA